MLRLAAFALLGLLTVPDIFNLAIAVVSSSHATMAGMDYVKFAEQEC
jgi:hypothetical protein